jgi:dTDP-4-amino-4,6-dideoxygalactose transaminase
LEVEWAKFNDLDPAGMVACSSGTAALHLAFEALPIPKRSTVAVPDYTMIACPRAVTMAGLKPVFIDCKKDTLLLRGWANSEHLMMVAVYGRRAEHPIVFTDKFLIEDLAEAHGLRPWQRTDAACWSFYKNKIVAGEEGGAVWFRSSEHAKLAKQLRTLGFTDAHDYRHVPRGMNYRMSNLHADAILGYNSLNGLKYYKERVEQRREIESWYDAECPAEWRQPYRDAVWVYDLRIPGMTYGKQREVVTRLQLESSTPIAARYGFYPCRRQDEYVSIAKWQGPEGLEWESDRASREIIYLPVDPDRTTKDTARKAFEIIRLAVGRE